MIDIEIPGSIDNKVNRYKYKDRYIHHDRYKQNYGTIDNKVDRYKQKDIFITVDRERYCIWNDR